MTQRFDSWLKSQEIAPIKPKVSNEKINTVDLNSQRGNRFSRQIYRREFDKEVKGLPPYGKEESVKKSTQTDSYQWDNPFGLEDTPEKVEGSVKDPHRIRHVYYNIMPPPPFHTNRVSRQLYRRDFDEEVSGVPPKAPLGSVTVTTNNELHQSPESLYHANLHDQDLYDVALQNRVDGLTRATGMASPIRPYWNVRQSRDLYRRDFDEQVTGVPPKAPLGSVKITTNAEHFQNPEDVYQAQMKQYNLEDKVMEKIAENAKKEPLDIKLGI